MPRPPAPSSGRRRPRGRRCGALRPRRDHACRGTPRRIWRPSGIVEELPQGAGRNSRAAGRRSRACSRASSCRSSAKAAAGKSTLLHLLRHARRPDSGEIHFDGQRIDNLPRSRRDALRNKQFGMIFQFYHLLPELTALENVLSPLMIARGAWSYFRRRKPIIGRGRRTADQVGLGHRLQHKPRELSGGEMQRAAIARALVANPKILLADEPTGNLDTATAATKSWRSAANLEPAERNLTIVMVTHDRGHCRAGRPHGPLGARPGRRRPRQSTLGEPRRWLAVSIGRRLVQPPNRRRPRGRCISAVRTVDSPEPASWAFRLRRDPMSPTNAPLKIYISGKLYDKADAKISVYDQACSMATACSRACAATPARSFASSEHLRPACGIRPRRSAWKSRSGARRWQSAIYDTLAANQTRRRLHPPGRHPRGRQPGPRPQPHQRSAGDHHRRPDLALSGRVVSSKGWRSSPPARMRNHPAALSPRIKSLNYLNNILAKIEGLQAGCIEALMLNHKGEVAECTGDNIFLVRDGVLLTPPTDAGILEGVTRARGDRTGRGGRHPGPRNPADPARRLHRRRMLSDRHGRRSDSGASTSTSGRSAPASPARSPAI